MRKPICLAIDPGNVFSGWIVCRLGDWDAWDWEILDFGKDKNCFVRSIVEQYGSDDVGEDVLCIEMAKAQGMPAANEMFETCVHVGRFLQIWSPKNWSYVFRPNVKLFLCGTSRSGDSNVRAALIDLWGGKDKAFGGKKCPKCNGRGLLGREKIQCTECRETPGWLWEPGPLLGIANDVWSALAVAVFWYHKPIQVHTVGRKQNGD